MAGRVVGEKYVLGRALGSGAMGEVFEARHLVTGMPVAIKLIFPHITRYASTGPRFLREARVTARVEHPGIVRVVDAGSDRDGTWFLVMELLEGETFRAALDRGDMPTIDALRVVRTLLSALAAAHAAGIIHRDLKPDNVFLARTTDGGTMVKILDFGIARELESASVTRTETTVGTPHYMAPEQATSAKTVGPAADVWSVGVMLYRITTGRLPFLGEGPYETVMKVCSEPHTPVLTLAPLAPAELAQLIERCLEKVPERRFPSAEALEAAMGSLLGDPIGPSIDARERATASARASSLVRRSNTPSTLDERQAGLGGMVPTIGPPPPLPVPSLVPSQRPAPSRFWRPGPVLVALVLMVVLGLSLSRLWRAPELPVASRALPPSVEPPSPPPAGEPPSAVEPPSEVVAPAASNVLAPTEAPREAPPTAAPSAPAPALAARPAQTPSSRATTAPRAPAAREPSPEPSNTPEPTIVAEPQAAEAPSPPPPSPEPVVSTTPPIEAAPSPTPVATAQPSPSPKASKPATRPPFVSF